MYLLLNLNKFVTIVDPEKENTGWATACEKLSKFHGILPKSRIKWAPN